MIVANDVSRAELGFGTDDNAALLLWRDGAGEGREQLTAQPKSQLALAVIRRALACRQSNLED
jgi:phosphopantothenoylcysteine decarboxylase/phosphopantothenate--cysteine ligase